MELERKMLAAEQPVALALCRPQAHARSAVLLLTAIAGIDAYIAQRARHLCDQGHLVAVLDYYRGTGVVPDLSTPQKIGAAVAALDGERLLGDIGHVLAWLEAQDLPRERTGVVGFCIGGALAIEAAALECAPGCAVAYYGQLRSAYVPDPLAAVPRLRAPLLGHYGDQDRLVPHADIAGFADGCRTHGKPAEIHVYPGAPHAFDEWHRPAVFRPVASADAWRRTGHFLDWHLRQRLPA